MKELSICDIAAAIGAEYRGTLQLVSAVCTDTRSLLPGCLFVALAGDNFDGHDYLERALTEGAAFAVSHQPSADSRVLVVKDTRRALLELAGLYRRTLGLSVVGITGSVGKTTTKEMTACVLESAFSTWKTPANLNNEVGLSQTILTLEKHHQAAVLELGVDAPGDMSPMAKAAAANVGIVTGIGVSHLQQFGTREAIRLEKLALRKGMPDGAPLLLCGDNDLLADVTDPRLDVIRYGIENLSCQIRGEHLRVEKGTTYFDILWDGNRYPAQLPAIGNHNVCNALAGFGAGVALGISPEQAAKALEHYTPTGMRQKVVEHHGLTVVEDCYNAAPDSMTAAMSTLAKMPCQGKRLAILSDMLELGEREEPDHRAIGVTAAVSADRVLCVGQRARWYWEGAEEAGYSNVRHYPSQEALLQGILTEAKAGDILWFKASRSMYLERIIEKLYEKL